MSEAILAALETSVRKTKQVAQYVLDEEPAARYECAWPFTKALKAWPEMSRFHVLVGTAAAKPPSLKILGVQFEALDATARPRMRLVSREEALRFLDGDPLPVLPEKAIDMGIFDQVIKAEATLDPPVSRTARKIMREAAQRERLLNGS